jgi:hypothetical protein
MSSMYRLLLATCEKFPCIFGESIKGNQSQSQTKKVEPVKQIYGATRLLRNMASKTGIRTRKEVKASGCWPDTEISRRWRSTLSITWMMPSVHRTSGRTMRARMFSHSAKYSAKHKVIEIIRHKVDLMGSETSTKWVLRT